eukprot:6648088-Alexandrium_andersonii.AAC.1
MAMNRMVTATHLLRHDAPHGFVNVQEAWCCQLLGSGFVYTNDTDDAFMCLGHDRWMWYGWPLGRRPCLRLLNALPLQAATESNLGWVPQDCGPNACVIPVAGWRPPMLASRTCGLERVATGFASDV